MSTLKVIGGVLALIAGGIMAAGTIGWGIMIFQGAGSIYNNTAWILNLIMVVVVIIGGIFGLKGKRSGGLLVLIVAVLTIIFGILYTSIDPWMSMFQVMTLSQWVVLLPYGITIEGLIMIIGGILILAGGSD